MCFGQQREKKRRGVKAHAVSERCINRSNPFRNRTRGESKGRARRIINTIVSDHILSFDVYGPRGRPDLTHRICCARIRRMSDRRGRSVDFFAITSFHISVCLAVFEIYSFRRRSTDAKRVFGNEIRTDSRYYGRAKKKKKRKKEKKKNNLI